MAVILGTKPKPQAAAQAAPAAAKPAQAADAAPVTNSAPKASTGGLSFLKTGAAAQTAMAKEDHKQEMNAKGKVLRWWIKLNDEKQITFLDGNVVDGVLDIPFFYEHMIQMNGKWTNFICTQDTEPCPICEGGNTPSYVGVMSIIDHSEETYKDKVYKNQRRLFSAKRETIKLLQKKAIKHGGLRGVKFDVSRTGDKSASVGSVFDFAEKVTDQFLTNAYKTDAAPINYAEVLAAQYLSASDLRKMGFGSLNSAVGSEKGPQDDTDYDSKM